MKIRKLALFVLIFGALATIAGCSNRSTVPDRVQLGALLALTGAGANYGKSLQQGIELATVDVNAAGGVHNLPLEFVFEDSQGDAKTGVSAFNKLTAVNHVPVVLGSISSVILAVSPLADEKHVVLVNSSAISPKICDRATNFVFSLMVSGTQEAHFMAAEFSHSHPQTPIAVLYSNNASGIDTANVLQQDARAAGIPIAAAEGYTLGATDFRTQLAKIGASGAHYGYLVAFSSADFARALRQSKQLGLRMQWFSYSGIETKETLQLASGAADGVIYSYPKYSASSHDVERFQARYREKYGSWADIYTITSYDAVKLLADVLQRSGSRAEDIQAGLRSQTGYNGMFGPVTFGQKQCVARKLMWKTVKGDSYTAVGTRGI